MANPQPDHHTRIAHELLEAVYRFAFTAAQFRLIFAVMRHSYGWNRKKTEPMGYKKLAAELDMPRSSVRWACESLLALKVLNQDADGAWTLQKDYDSWTREDQQALPLGPVDKSKRGAVGRPLGGGGLSKRGRWVAPLGGGGLPTYKVIDNLEKERKGTSPILPNGKTDTLRHRAELGHAEFPLEDHQDFKRLDFGLQKELVTDWKEAKKKNACRKCQRAPRTSDAWPFCRACTSCLECGTKKGDFKARGAVIFCASCAPAISEKSK